jgi:hypothetical protein
MTEMELALEVLRTDIERVGNDPFGPVKCGKVVLRGRLTQVEHVRLPNDSIRSHVYADDDSCLCLPSAVGPMVFHSPGMDQLL